MTAIAIGQSQCRQPGGGGGADDFGLSPGGGGVACLLMCSLTHVQPHSCAALLMCSSLCCPVCPVLVARAQPGVAGGWNLKIAHGVEPEPRPGRFTQQNPGIGPDFGVLIICTGTKLAATIRTRTPVQEATGACLGSAARGTYAGPLSLLGLGVWRARDHSAEPRERRRGSDRRGK